MQVDGYWRCVGVDYAIVPWLIAPRTPAFIGSASVIVTNLDEQRRLRVLRQHVRTDQLLGVEAVALGQPPVLAVPRVSAAAPVVRMDAGAKSQALEHIDEHEVRRCTACVLSRSRTQTVFGDGSADARLMFIGEGPGMNEDIQGKPFVGPAGELLSKMIVAMGLSRPQVYIANVVKCRPPNNRTPAPDEVAACSDYLRRQIAIIMPSVIVTLGGPAAKLVIDIKSGITAIRGTWHQYVNPDLPHPIPVMPTFHPAYLLRAYTTDNRKKVWSDLQQAMAKLKDTDN
jgi:uracil-DNA glycosylase family 4